MRRGIAYSQKHDYDRGIADFSEAILLNPKLAMAFYLRGVAYDANGNHDRAAADLNEAIRLDSRIAKIH
jgi:tetratricopeptide (TPR) repeat protein